MNIAEQITKDLGLVLPETGALVLIVLMVLVSLYSKASKTKNIFFLSSIICLFTLCLLQTLDQGNQPRAFLFYDHIIISGKGSYAKCLLTFVAFLYWIYKELLPQKQESEGELYVTILAQLLGSYVIVQAGSYVTLFLGVEIVSITSYIIAYFGNTDKAKVAAMKYFLFGAFSSALMVYGISWMYGITGNYLINEFPHAVKPGFDPAFYYLAIICLYAGLLFKIAAIPFHLWTPDVYSGLPNRLLSLLSLLPKISGLIALYHVHESLSFLPTLGTISYRYLFVVSIATMVFGNLIALRQNQFRLFFAFSSIAQSGLLLSLIPSQNIDTLLFYLTLYTLMNFGLLFIYEVLVSSNTDTPLQSLSGLGLKHPILGIGLLICVASLIGIPPFIGFIGKVFIVSALFKDFDLGSIHSIACITVVFTTFLSLAYYIKLPYYLFVKKYEDSDSKIINKSQLYFSAILVLPLIIGFFSFEWLLHWLQYVK